MSEKPTRRGRPALDAADPSVPLSFSIPSKQLQAVSNQAKKRRETVPEWIRRVLRLAADEDQ